MSRDIFFALLYNTLQKEIRNKTLLFLFVLSLALIVLMGAISSFMVNTEVVKEGALFGNMKFSIFYSIISFWGATIGIILGVSTLKSDMEYGVSQQIIAFPIKPFFYMITRILGSWLIVNFYYIFTLILALIVFTMGDQLFVFNTKIILSFFVFSIKILICISLASFFSMHFSKIISLISTVVMYALITASNVRFAEGIDFSSLSFFSGIGLVIHYLFPQINTINVASKGLLLDKAAWSFGIFDFFHLIISFSFLLFIIFISWKGKDYQSVE